MEQNITPPIGTKQTGSRQESDSMGTIDVPAEAIQNPRGQG
jgi:hypothetical protein